MDDIQKVSDEIKKQLQKLFNDSNEEARILAGQLNILKTIIAL